MRTSLKTLALVASIVTLFGIVETANAAISFDINVSRGPVYSVSFTNYADYAIPSTFGGPVGSLNTSDYPWYFSVIAGDTVEATDFIVSSNNSAPSGGFTSWLGQANPTGNFSQEVGNRLYFASTWITSATPISLDHLTFSITSAPNPILNQTLVYGDFGTGGLVQGWNYGPDGIPNTGDDFYDTATGDTRPMNVIVVSLGLGNGVSALGALGATNQEKLTNTELFIAENIESITFTVSYDHGGGNIESASKILTMNGFNAPEPASLALFGIGVVALLARRHSQTM